MVYKQRQNFSGYDPSTHVIVASMLCPEDMSKWEVVEIGLDE